MITHIGILQPSKEGIIYDDYFIDKVVDGIGKVISIGYDREPKEIRIGIDDNGKYKVIVMHEFTLLYYIDAEQ